MTIRELYAEALEDKVTCKWLINLIELLVYEKKVLHMDSDITEMDYFLQDKFSVKMNQHLAEYEGRKKG